jgi:hypothetical protein
MNNLLAVKYKQFHPIMVSAFKENILVSGRLLASSYVEYEIKTDVK